MIIPNRSPTHSLVLAPRGRDAVIASTLLSEAGMIAVICADVRALQTALGDEVAFVVVAEEAMRSADLRGIAAWVTDQPPWSDLPFIVLSSHADDQEATTRLSEILGNVTLLERPFKPVTFVSVARTAGKARQRQYQVRGTIEALRESQDGLIRLTESLEQRVLERTAELEKAHAAVLGEISQREQTEEKLRQSQKLEMIGQLTGGVAHDFNNLLMAVVGNLELLRKHTSSDARATRLIDGALQGAQRGASLTQRLLAFARRQELTVAPIDLSLLVGGLKELIDRTIGRQIELITHLPDGLPAVLADANQVELALLNLVVNARDAMPDGGRMTIAIKAAGSNGSTKVFEHGCLRLIVTDTGMGMTEEVLQKATEPFFSTKELGKGTGLGLSMVHGLALQLGGSFHLSSKAGEGTSAELALPITTSAIEISAPATDRTLQKNTRKLTVMIVDDDALIAMSTCAMVEDLGHSVIEVTSGAKALEILQTGAHIDLLLTDFSMPKMNGGELAKAVRVLRPDLPILLATGYAELPTGFDLALPRLGKPFLQDQLESAIAMAVGGAR